MRLCNAADKFELIDVDEDDLLGQLNRRVSLAAIIKPTCLANEFIFDSHMSKQ
jgi:hypothetical protein